MPPTQKQESGRAGAKASQSLDSSHFCFELAIEVLLAFGLTENCETAFWSMESCILNGNILYMRRGICEDENSLSSAAHILSNPPIAEP